jgi:isomerase DpgB
MNMTTMESVSSVLDAVETQFYLRVPHWSSAEAIWQINELCDRAEDAVCPGPAVLKLIGAEPGEGATTGWAGETSVTLVSKWERVVRRLERLSVPTIAVVSGECTGQSLDVLLATDYRIGSPSVRLGLARAEGMLWPGMALHRLVQQVSLARVRRMALFGQCLSALEAVELGLLDEVTDDVAGAVSVVTRQASAMAGTELAVRRRLLLEAAVSSHEDAIGVHLSAVDRTLRRTRRDDAGEN